MINLDNILPDTTAEILKGRKPAAIGEIRDFNGKKYRKTPNGWRLVSSRSTDVKTEKIGEKTKFSDEELREDYKKIQEIDSKAEKTVLKEKYNVDTYKSADIERAILLQLQSNRGRKKEFSKEDFREWIRLYPNIGTYKTLTNSLKDESQEFIDYIKSIYKDKVETLSSKKYLSYADEYQLDIYKNIRKYENEKVNKTDTSRVKLIQNLSNQTKDFKETYLSQTKRFAEKQFEFKKQFVEKHKEWLDKFYTLSYKEQREKEELYKKIRSTKLVVGMGKEKFVTDIVESAKRSFEQDIERIAVTIRERKVNEENINIKPIEVGYKGISMKIGDGERSLYARAILAAEFSEYKRPHYRFIITESDKYKDW